MTQADRLLPGGVLPDIGGPEGSAESIDRAESALELLGESLAKYDALLRPVLRSLTTTVMHADGLLSTVGSVSFVESSRGTGVAILPVSPERVEDFLRSIAVEEHSTEHGQSSEGT